MDWTSIAIAVVTGVTAGVTTGLSSASSFRAEIDKANRKIDLQDGEIKNLRDEKIKALDIRVEKMEENCQQHQNNTMLTAITTTLEAMQKTVDRTENIVSRIDKELGQTQTLTEVQEKYIKSVHGEIQGHAARTDIHGGKR